MIIPDELTVRFQSTLNALESAVGTVSDWLASRGASEQVRSFAELTLEELATNAIKYGFNDVSGQTFEVRVVLSVRMLILTFLDDGRPFDPLLAPEPDLALAAEERAIGGLGLHLVRQMSDAMEYSRDGNRNRVTLHKRLD